MVHEKAIYILEGRSYFVEKYDHDERRVQVREAEVDYYTDAITYTKVRILERFAEEPRRNARRNHGEVHVTSQVVGFKKIKFHTNENVGSGELTMPENEMHTTAYWLTVPREIMRALPFSLEERRDGVVALSYTLGQLAALFLMCDRHDLGVALGDNGQGEARIERGLRRLGARRARQRAPERAARRGLRAERVRLRQLPRRDRPLRAALPPARQAARREPRADRGLRRVTTAARPASARSARSAAAARRSHWRSSTRCWRSERELGGPRAPEEGVAGLHRKRRGHPGSPGGCSAYGSSHTHARSVLALSHGLLPSRPAAAAEAHRRGGGRRRGA